MNIDSNQKPKSKNIFFDSALLTVLFFKKNWALLLVALVLTEAFHSHFDSVISQSSVYKNDTLRILGYLGQIMTSLTEFVFFTMFVPLNVMAHDAGRSQGTFWEFTRKHILSLTAEGLRATAMILLWTFALILPGIFKYLRYSFVPYVVVADPEYQAGRRDALDYSNRLVAGFTIQLLLIILGFSAIELFRSDLRQSFPLFTSPLPALAIGIVFFTVNLMTNVLLFRIYQLRVKKLEA